ncbi:hypothetical protein LIER_16641 [Lithospermum erythrorhizon]|uniref:Uncharacterized protein n=1 Tax=Lithospermum erythrorhizon TaxID=34254 RepID=A0AAV3Q8V1_LITER
MGDFNEVLHSNENVSQQRLRLHWQMENFRRVVQDCGLVDLGYSGFPFTWSNNFISSYSTRVRLDKDWKDYYPEAKVTYLSTNTSDHLPLLLQLGTESTGVAKTKGIFMKFKLETTFVKPVDLLAVYLLIKRAAQPLFIVYKKIYYIKLGVQRVVIDGGNHPSA